ncbi:MAG: NUDIX hydrolase [Nanoarchaeota archaeon]|nr:NUDIX hydrolase [Nanoarchaeota archaeon]
MIVDNKKNIEGKFIPNVRVFVPNLEGKILLLKRGRGIGKGLWNLPGGKIDLGKSKINSCRDECFEEAGIKVYGLKELTNTEFLPVLGNDINHYFTYYFRASGYSGNIKLNDESSDYDFIDYAEISRFSIAFNQDAQMVKYFLGKFN